MRLLASANCFEVRCRRCSHERLIDLTEVVWPREKPVHTLAKVLRCQACKDERKKPQPDLVRCGHDIPRAIRQQQNGAQHVDPTRGIFVSDYEQGEIGPDLFLQACKFGLEPE